MGQSRWRLHVLAVGDLCCSILSYAMQFVAVLCCAVAKPHVLPDSFLEEDRQTLTESWKKAESARKFLQGEVAALKSQREKLKEELQLMQDKMVTLRDKPKTPPDITF